MITLDELQEQQSELTLAKIKVIGIGGAGNNIVSSMVKSSYDGFVEFIAANTDAQALNALDVPIKIQLGIKLTKGLGSGANPEVGKRAAQEDLDKVLEVIGDADIVFLAAGMGGGTGSGAMPVIAQALRERGILTVAIVTRPFSFEGRRRERVALETIDILKQSVDTLLVVPNQKLIDMVGASVSMMQAFELVNDVLAQSVRGISYIITRSGHINVDFADLRTIMKDMGLAVMGSGRASGVDRAIVATNMAISSTLLENMSIAGARGVLINITGGPNLSLQEINQAASLIYQQADPDANIILGSVIDQTMTDELSVTVVATGFGTQQPVRACVLTQELTSNNELVQQKSTEPQKNEQKPLIVVSDALGSDPLDTPAFMRSQSVDFTSNT